MTYGKKIVQQFDLAPTPELDAAPDILCQIHRGRDAYVCFVRKPRPGDDITDKHGKPLAFQNLFSIKVSELQEMFPSMRDWLAQDSYFTINSTYRAAHWKNPWTGLPDSWRIEPKPAEKIKGTLKFLNACYVDCDVGREDSEDPVERLSWRGAAALAGDMMDAGELPQASIFAKSGRGLYIFWLLRDEKNPGQPPPAFYERICIYKLINKRIIDRLKHLAADQKTHDAARVLRLHGSRHSKSGNIVQYLFQTDATLRPFTYTIKELADFFGVRELETSLPEQTRAITQPEFAKLAKVTLALTAREFYGRKVAEKGSAPNRRRGYQQRGAYRAQDIATLEQYAGGWKKGGRRFRLLLYARFLHEAGNDQEAVLQAVSVMAGNCRPPYPSDPNDQKLADLVRESISKPRIYKTQSLVKWFKVTVELAKALNLQSIIPAELAEERRPELGGKRKEIRDTRMNRIRELIAERSGLTCRAIERILKAEGIPCNRQSINEDMRFFGYIVRGRGRPQKKKPLHPTLPFMAEGSKVAK